MSFITKFLSSIPAVVFLIIGVFWVLQPGIMAENFGMVLSSDLGLSSQIGDLGSYFVSSALMIFYGIYTNNTHWFYPPILIMLLTALFRTLSTLLHDAPFAADMIGSEILFSGILIYAIHSTREVK
ncbi:hypothetical protein OAT15_01815 [Gammaproteobacteria bacterium]|nr:hypothetical protein [Gammaproteobacteria bacterium]